MVNTSILFIKVFITLSTTTTTLMDTFTAIENRRSIKHYDPSHVMSEPDVRQLMEAVLLSPTSFNMQNWRFVLVDRRDPALREQLWQACWKQDQIKDAALVVALCANLKAPMEQPERYWRLAPEAVQQMIVPMIGSLYQDNPQLQRDEAMRSGGLAGQTLMLAAKAMGLDTCPMVGFLPDKVAELIQLPPDHVITMLITVGKANKPANVRSGPLPYEEVVFQQRFA
jgi:nitroreductase